MLAKRNGIDEATVEAAQAGDRDAAGRMLADVEHIITYRVMRSVHLSRQDDCAQVVRLKVFKAIQRFDLDRSNWRTFVASRVPGMVIDFLRDDYGRGQYVRKVGLRNRTVQLSVFDTAEEDEVGCSNFVEPSTEDEESTDWLEAMERSPQLRALSLWLRGFLMCEIAEQMGICESAVSQQIKRIREDRNMRTRIAAICGIELLPEDLS